MPDLSKEEFQKYLTIPIADAKRTARGGTHECETMMMTKAAGI